MQPVPGKGLLLPGLSRLSLVPGCARDRLSNTNQRLGFSLPQFPSVDSKVPSCNLPGVGAYTIIQLVHTAPVSAAPALAQISGYFYSQYNHGMFSSKVLLHL